MEIREEQENKIVRAKMTTSGRGHLISTLLGTCNNADFGFNDAKIVLTDGEFFAMKGILAARSRYFQTMFNNSSNFKEGQGDVDIPTTKKLMEKVVKFLYSGLMYIEDLTLTEYIELADLVRMMMLDEALLLLNKNVKNHIHRFQLNQPSSSSDETPDIFHNLLEAFEMSLDKRLADISLRLSMAIFSPTSKPVRFVRRPDSGSCLPTLLDADHCYLSFKAFQYLITRKDLDVSSRLKLYNNWVETNGDIEDVDMKNEIRESFGEIWTTFKVEDMDEAIKHGLFTHLEVFNAIKRSVGTFTQENARLSSENTDLKKNKKDLEREVKVMKDRLRDYGSDSDDGGYGFF